MKPMNKTEESRLTMTTMACKAAVAEERSRCIAIVEYAYQLTGGPPQGLIPLALAAVKLGRPLDESKGVLDVSAETTKAAPSPLEQYANRWNQGHKTVEENA